MELSTRKINENPSTLNNKYSLLIRTLIPIKYRSKLISLYVRGRYSGRKFYCPFCGGHFKKLLPEGVNAPFLKERNIVGGGYRLNMRCPSCYSLDRERLIYLYLISKTRLFYENKIFKILHVAPEKNLQKVLAVHPNIDYFSVDLDSPVATIKMDITKIGWKENSFDIIICNHVLEHIADDQIAMSELYRVLRPKGWAILQVPISLSLNKTYEDPRIITPKEREQAFGQKDHVRIYARDYKDRLECAGFSVEVYNFAKTLGDSIAYRYAVQTNENLYICSKTDKKS